MRAKGTSGAPPPGLSDREIWRRSREIEASLDETEHLLDLAAYADNRLDEDDAARIAALLARDLAAADDVAAARLVADAAMTAAAPAAAPAIIERAALLVGEERGEARVIPFRTHPPMARPWYGAATWSSLAAAMVLAGWLGFNLGSGLSSAPPFGRGIDEASASDLLDPAPLLLRDFTEGSQI